MFAQLDQQSTDAAAASAAAAALAIAQQKSSATVPAGALDEDGLPPLDE